MKHLLFLLPIVLTSCLHEDPFLTLGLREHHYIQDIKKYNAQQEKFVLKEVYTGEKPLELPEPDSEYMYFIGKAIENSTEFGAKQSALVNAAMYYVFFKGFEIDIHSCMNTIAKGVEILKVQSEIRTATIHKSRLHIKELEPIKWRVFIMKNEIGTFNYGAEVIVRVPRTFDKKR